MAIGLLITLKLFLDETNSAAVIAAERDQIKRTPDGTRPGRGELVRINTA